MDTYISAIISPDVDTTSTFSPNMDTLITAITVLLGHLHLYPRRTQHGFRQVHQPIYHNNTVSIPSNVPSNVPTSTPSKVPTWVPQNNHHRFHIIPTDPLHQYHPIYHRWCLAVSLALFHRQHHRAALKYTNHCAIDSTIGCSISTLPTWIPRAPSVVPSSIPSNLLAGSTSTPSTNPQVCLRRCRRLYHHVLQRTHLRQHRRVFHPHYHRIPSSP